MTYCGGLQFQCDRCSFVGRSLGEFVTQLGNQKNEAGKKSNYFAGTCHREFQGCSYQSGLMLEILVSHQEQ